MRLRKYTEEDLSTIEQINPFFSVQIKYHSGISNENIVCIEKDNTVIGVGFLTLHQTLNHQKVEITFSTQTSTIYEENSDIESLLIDGLILRFNEIKKEYNNKYFYLRVCYDTKEIDNIQLLLSKGFSIKRAIPVLKYDLTKNILHYKIPEDVHIVKYEFDKISMENYLKANFRSSTELDCETDIYFNLGDPNFACYTAICNNEIVGAISVWNISEERGATENIFVVPSYRRKNIARELISAALDTLKERNMNIATLSVIGTNLSAIKLYLSCGYSLYYNLIEMVYE